MKRGEVIATVSDLFGDIVEEIKAPLDGIIVSQRTYATIHPGEWTVYVGSYSVEVSGGGQTVESLAASLEIGPSHSYDKLEDLLDSVAGSVGPHLHSLASVSFPSVSVGTIGSQLINNFNSTTQQGEPVHSAVIGGSSRWYLLTAQTDATMLIDTLGSDIATVLAVYTGSSIFSLQTVATNLNGAPDGVRSLVKFPATNGTSYLVAVDGVNGAQGNINLNWRMGIAPNPAAPAKTLVTTNGDALTLQAGVTNDATTPSYQWQVNGANIAGATNATFTLSNIQFNQVGSYGVAISNLLGVVVNPIATISMQSPLNLTRDTSVNPTGFRVTGSATEAMVLQSSTNLFVWNPLYTNSTPLLPINYLDTNSAKHTQGFYRLKSWP